MTWTPCVVLVGHPHSGCPISLQSLAAKVPILSILALTGLGIQAQTELPLLPQEQQPLQTESSGKRPGYRGYERNPFALTPLILERSREDQTTTDFQPADPNVKVPNMKLRGVVVGSDGRKAALLEVQGLGTFVVREGDRIGLNPAVANAAIRVTRIDRMQVEVEAGSLKQVIIVQ